MAESKLISPSLIEKYFLEDIGIDEDKTDKIEYQIYDQLINKLTLIYFNDKGKLGYEMMSYL